MNQCLTCRRHSGHKQEIKTLTQLLRVVCWVFSWWAVLCTHALFVFVKPTPLWATPSMESCWRSDSTGPQGPTHNQSLFPPSVVCFALISGRMQLTISLWVTLCLCVLCGSFSVMAAWGQRRCWRKSKHTSPGQYWLSLFLLIWLPIEAKYIKNRCNFQVVFAHDSSVVGL